MAGGAAAELLQSTVRTWWLSSLLCWICSLVFYVMCWLQERCNQACGATCIRYQLYRACTSCRPRVQAALAAVATVPSAAAPPARARGRRQQVVESDEDEDSALVAAQQPAAPASTAVPQRTAAAVAAGGEAEPQERADAPLALPSCQALLPPLLPHPSRRLPRQQAEAGGRGSRGPTKTTSHIGVLVGE